MIETLFPSTDDCFSRMDKRDVWYMDTETLTKAVTGWCNKQPWIRNGHVNVFTDLIEKLRPDAQQRVDVDDCLYVMLLQWAKLEAWYVKKAYNRSTAIEKALPSGLSSAILDDSSLASALATSVAIAHESQAIEQGAAGVGAVGMGLEGNLARKLSTFPLTNLRAILGTMYRPEETHELTDIQQYATCYIQTMRSRRAVSNPELEQQQQANSMVKRSYNREKMSFALQQMDERSSREMKTLLKECVLWDTAVKFTEKSALAMGTSGITKHSYSQASSKTRASMQMKGNGSKAIAAGIQQAQNQLQLPSAKVYHYADNISIRRGVPPELFIGALLLLIRSYSDPILLFLDKVNFYLQAFVNSEHFFFFFLENRLKSIQ
jgi:hypothetical protein